MPHSFKNDECHMADIWAHGRMHLDTMLKILAEVDRS